MPNIVYEAHSFNNRMLVFCVKEQSKEFTEWLHARPDHTFAASNGFAVRSVAAPALRNDVVFLRGTNKGNDDEPCYLHWVGSDGVLNNLNQAMAECVKTYKADKKKILSINGIMRTL